MEFLLIEFYNQNLWEHFPENSDALEVQEGERGRIKGREQCGSGAVATSAQETSSLQKANTNEARKSSLSRTSFETSPQELFCFSLMDCSWKSFLTFVGVNHSSAVKQLNWSYWGSALMGKLL